MLTDDLSFFLFAVGFISLLNLMITSGIWLSYLTSRKRYLTIACAAAALEVCRHTTDFLSGANPTSTTFAVVSSFLQFGSTLFLSISLLFIYRNSLGREIWLFISISLAFLIATVTEFFLFPALVAESPYLGAIPLIGVTGILLWRGLLTGKVFTPSKVFLLVASALLLLIRITLPALPINNFYLLLYYMEYLSFSMMLTALILYEIEYSNRKVRKLLDSRTQSEQDLQFIVDNSLDIILVVDDTGLLRSWSRQANEVFGYTREQAIGKVHMNDMFEADFWNQNSGAVDEFSARMESIESKSFMVDVRVRKVSHNNADYSIFVLRLIAEPG
ncbi:MAG: PAS domain S-box protein [Pseudohongiellaceae bacterium]